LDAYSLSFAVSGSVWMYVFVITVQPFLRRVGSLVGHDKGKLLLLSFIV